MTRRDRNSDAIGDHDGNNRRAWGRPGGDWAGMRPSIDNPFTWSLPIARISGITVRVHLFFLAYIIVQLAQASLAERGQPLGFAPVAMCMGLLVVLVLVHEFGHCLACRLTGGTADEILMWPLGGLAYTHPPHNWRAHLLTTIGGPIVNLFVCLLAGSMLWLVTQHDRDWQAYVFPNPLHFGEVLVGSPLSRSLAHQALYFTHAISLVLLLFNLIPAFPLDGGRVLQELLWPRYGYSQSMRYAVRVGYVAGLAMGAFGWVADQWTVVGVGVFGVISCWLTHRQLEFSESMLADDEPDDYEMSLQRGGADNDEEHQQHTVATRPTRSGAAGAAEQRRAAEQEQKDAAEVDRILLKIKQHGMASLTRTERSALRQATDRKRHEGEGEEEEVKR